MERKSSFYYIHRLGRSFTEARQPRMKQIHTESLASFPYFPFQFDLCGQFLFKSTCKWKRKNRGLETELNIRRQFSPSLNSCFLKKILAECVAGNDSFSAFNVIGCTRYSWKILTK